MKIYLPNSAFLGNIDPFLKSFDVSDPDKLEITANKKWISIHPVVLSMVGALGLKVSATNIKCEKLEATSKHYLERMGLFKFLQIESDMSIVEHESAGRFIPLTQIKDSENLSKFLSDMVPLLHLEPTQAESIKYIVSELVRNVLEHSGSSSNGAILCAQYYSKSKTIRIGIADTGRGIKNSIDCSYNTTSHMQAINLALTPGITGTTRKEGGTELNAGAGLFFIKSIANVNRDFFMIYSGNAMYKLLKRPSNKTNTLLHVNPFDDRHSKGENFPNWEGTMVGIDIPLETTKEFSILFDLIRDTYKKAIKGRKKLRYKKPRFIS